jgi:integrase
MADVYRRCACRDENGRQLGAKCPRLAADPKHGTWTYYVSGIDPRTNKRIQIRSSKDKDGATLPSKRAAQQARAEALTGLSQGRYRGDDKTQVDAYLKAWLTRRERDGMRPSTLRMYRRYVQNDIAPALGALKLREVRRHHVDTFIRQLRDDGRGPTTIRRIHATLSSAFSDAERLDLIDGNPAHKVDLPKVNKARISVWEPAEVDMFLKHMDQHRLGAMFELEVLTGLRRGELCGLRWSDVDLVNAKLTVRVQLTQVGKQVVEGPVKTEHGQDRVVALDSRATGALMAWRLTQEAERDAWGDDYHPTDRVFTKEDGTDLRPANVSRIFDTAVARTGLPDMRFHDLRHVHASLQIAAHVPLAVISKRLGHSTIAITSDLYGHLLDDANRQAAEAASSLLAPRERGSVITVHTQPGENT